MNNEVLSRLLSDLGKVHQVCIEENLEEVPEVCNTYLDANKDALQFFVQQVFSKTDETQRRALLSQHRELDASVVSNAFQPIALNVLSSAERKRKSDFLASVDEDDLHMLLRVLKYAKYCSVDPNHFDLWFSPIEEHGLKRRFGNFESITQSERLTISWHIADILYGAEKSKALTKCKELGLDLERKEAVLIGERYPDWKNKWSTVLSELVRYKAECDLV